jgi:3-oxoacyl-[acyl-carrier-protein] synthase II
MSSLVVTGWGVLSAAGEDPGALVAAVEAARPIGGDPAAVHDDPLPASPAAVVADFDVRKALGRKGTSFFDRATGLALVACGQALRDSGLAVDDGNRARVGVVLGTTIGSLKSTVEYSRETLVQERPYLVNPVLFPNTVMNCAAGQAAIWYGLRGVNATVAGGQLAFLHALRYAANALHRGYVDALLVGAVEEYTPHTAWAAELTSGQPAGEAAAVFVLERAPAGGVGMATGHDRRRHGEILAVATGFSPGGAPEAVAATLSRCIRRALNRAGVAAEDVRAVATGDAPGETVEADAATTALGHRPAMLAVKAAFGECQAVTGGLALATLLSRHRGDPQRSGELALITARSRDGAVGAAVVRGWCDGGVDHG